MTTTRISEDLNAIQSHENVRATTEGAISCAVAQGQVVPRGREQLFTEFDSNTCIYGTDDRIAERDLDLGAVFGQHGHIAIIRYSQTCPVTFCTMRGK
jgi:hypothetical protein